MIHMTLQLLCQGRCYRLETRALRLLPIADVAVAKRPHAVDVSAVRRLLVANPFDVQTNPSSRREIRWQSTF